MYFILVDPFEMIPIWMSIFPHFLLLFNQQEKFTHNNQECNTSLCNLPYLTM